LDRSCAAPPECGLTGTNFPPPANNAWGGIHRHTTVAASRVRRPDWHTAIHIEEGENMAVILVADDEEMVRVFATIVLRKAGHDVVTARDGFEAVRLYRTSAHLIDVVITDITMPVMDGPQAVQLIRAARPEARIICMSGNGGKECPPGVLFLQKPFTPDALCASVSELLVAV
jgi:CheY-like chemotaxis protein